MRGVILRFVATNHGSRPDFTPRIAIPVACATDVSVADLSAQIFRSARGLAHDVV